jgi:hypothetical protein
MSADGNTIVILTINLTTFAVGFSIYTYTNSVWTYKTSLSPTFTSYNKSILKISGDGTTFVYFIPTTLSFPDVLVYQYDSVTSEWNPTPITLQNPVNFYRNGATIDISYDGSTIIRSFVSSVDSQGHACIYSKNPNFTWSSPVVLNEPIGNSWGDTSVAISGDGLTACVGAQSSSPVIVYKKTGGTWNQDSTLSYNPNQISMSYDGSVIALMFSDHVSITNGTTISYTSPAYIELSSDGTKLLVARYDNVTIYNGDVPTVVTQYVNYNNNTGASMNATGSRIVSLEISISDPKIDIFDIGTGGVPGSFTPSGLGTGIAGAGFLTDGQESDPFFGFLKPKAYVNGGFGNSYEYGQPGVPKEGGFGGGQSPLNLLTGLTSVTGYNAIRPTIPLNTDEYIYSIDISNDGNTFLVTMTSNFLINENVYVYQYTGSDWVETQLYDKLYSVSLSLDGNVWLLQNDIWRNGSFETQLEVPEILTSAGGSTQGKSTCISSDGNTAVITNTSFTYDIQYNRIPELYCNVYAYSSGSWNKINSFNIIHNSLVFGEPYTEVDTVATRCAISGDGNTMAIGTDTYYVTYNGQSYTRQTEYINVYVYKKTEGSWVQIKQITFEYPYGGISVRGTNMTHLCVDYNGNKIVFPGYEYTCDTDTLTAIGVLSPLSTTITFSKTTSNVYAWSDAQTIYVPSTPSGFKVELVNSCTLLAFGSNVLVTTDSVFSGNKAIVFVDMVNPTTTCTAATSNDHGYPRKYEVQITGTNSFDGTWIIKPTSSNTFAFQAFGGPTETSGYVSGTTTGISGGGGYTGSAGDGVSGATCYADESVVNFTDLGAKSNTAGYVTVSLIDPAPVKEIWSLSLEWETTKQIMANGTFEWFERMNCFVAISDYAVTLLSKDGKVWTPVKNNITVPPSSSFVISFVLKASATTLIAVEYYSGIWTSTDAQNWTLTLNYPTSIPTAIDFPYFSTSYANGFFIVTPFGNSLLISNDGITWTIIYPNVSPGRVVYGNGIYLGIVPSSYYVYGLLYTSTDLVDWTQVTDSNVYTNTSQPGWSDITYVNGTFIASTSGTYLYKTVTSVDGITWIGRETGGGDFVYGNGTLVSLSDHSYSVDNGISWSPSVGSSPIQNNSRALGSYSPTLQYFVFTDTFQFYISLEGKYIVPASDEIIPSGFPSNIVWCDTLGIFVANTKFSIITSVDGKNWVEVINFGNNATVNGGGSVSWSSELGIVIAYFYNDNTGSQPWLYSSTDGLTWTKTVLTHPLRTVTSTTYSQYPNSCWSKELGIFTSGDAISRNGKDWTWGFELQNAVSIAWSPKLGLFVASQAQNFSSFTPDSLYYSTDGLTWMFLEYKIIFSISWSPQLEIFIGFGCEQGPYIGGYLSIYMSRDGLTWINIYLDPTIYISEGIVIWSEELAIFIVFYRSDFKIKTLISYDGITWIPSSYFNSNYGITGVTWSPNLGMFAAVSSFFTPGINVSYAIKTF